MKQNRSLKNAASVSISIHLRAQVKIRLVSEDPKKENFKLQVPLETVICHVVPLNEQKCSGQTG